MLGGLHSPSMPWRGRKRERERERDNVGASIIRIGFWGILYYNYNPILESERERERERDRERERERERERVPSPRQKELAEVTDRYNPNQKALATSS